MTLLRETLRELPDATFVDGYESDDAYLVVLDVPGVDAVDVSADRSSLVVTAERDADVPEDYDAVRRERPEVVDVTLPLPPDADGEAAEWTVERGVLEVTVPKERAEATD